MIIGPAGFMHAPREAAPPPLGAPPTDAERRTLEALFDQGSGTSTRIAKQLRTSVHAAEARLGVLVYRGWAEILPRSSCHIPETYVLTEQGRRALRGGA